MRLLPPITILTTVAVMVAAAVRHAPLEHDPVPINVTQK
jgi:hypothetical protein